MPGRRNWSKIGEIIQKIKEHDLKYKEGAKQFGIKVRDIYDYNKWRREQKRKGNNNEQKGTEMESANEEELSAEAPDKGENSSISVNASLLPEQIEDIILKYRKEHPEHGYKRIEDNLKSRHFIVVSRKKIRQVLKMHGLEKTCDSSFDLRDESNPPKGSRRFEANYPRELYQMDVTYVYLTGIPVLYLVVIVDDHSRFCTACELTHDQRGTTMIEVLHRAIERYGRPRKLLTDQGSNFYTWSYERTVFQRYLDDMEIEHIVTDPHSPQTVGKVERLNQTLQRELFKKVRFTSYKEARGAVENYIHSYNYDRPHQGIDGACPAERFHGINGETAKIEATLSSKSLDLSKGYLIFKDQDHTLSVVGSSNGLQVFLDGKLLQQGGVNQDDKS